MTYLTQQAGLFISFATLFGVGIFTIIYAVASYRSGKDKYREEFLSTLYKENNYLKTKVNYLVNKVHDLEQDHQRQLNFQADEVKVIHERLIAVRHPVNQLPDQMPKHPIINETGAPTLTDILGTQSPQAPFLPPPQSAIGQHKITNNIRRRQELGLGPDQLLNSING